ncbi:MAG: MFS transporter [Sphingomonas sp.]
MNAVAPARRHLTLALLCVVAALSYIDRQVLTVLMEAIKTELVLTDTVLGLLSGFSFAIFYVFAGFPIARYADRGDRRLVIALCVAVWSAATAACGLAQNAWHMALARIGVAAGEAGAGPAGYSLATEIYPIDRRVTVISILLAANSVGLAAGLALTGWLATMFNWREVFFIVGIPGLGIALAVWLLAAEPRRGRGAVAVTAPVIRLGKVFAVMARSTSLRWVAVLLIAVPITGFGFLIWSPSFFQRVHHLSVEQTGYWLGLATLMGLVFGNLAAGWLGDRYGKDNPRFNGALAAGGLLAAFPFALIFVLAPDVRVSLAAFAVLKFLMTLHLGPIMTLCFAQVPKEMRAMMSATINMMISLAGIGLGAFLVGRLSDSFQLRYGDQSLRYSLLVICFGLLVGAVAAFMAARTARPLATQE